MNSASWFESSSDVDDVAEQQAEGDYYDFTLPIQAGYTANITSVSTSLQYSGTGPTNVTLRWSVDGFAADLGTGGSSMTANINQVQGPNTTITFRMYMTRASAGSSTAGTGRINSLSIGGTTTLSGPNAPVVLNCPTNTTTAACQTQAQVNTAFATWLATASGTGGCSGVLTNNNAGAPSACGGSTTVTFTYVSTCAPLTTTCQATFTVPTSPTVTLNCPVNITTAACQSQAQVNAAFNTWLATASASGGCNGTLTNNNIGAPLACGGSTTVTFTYTSTCSPTTTTCQATFTVPTSPTITLTCPVNTTTTACQTQAQVNAAFTAWLATASASGGCNGSLNNNNIGAPLACGGSTTVTFTYTNSCAPLTTTCQATFTVPAAPTVVLTCPANTTTAACQTQGAVDAAFATWLATASATNGCGGVLTNDNTGAPSSGGGSTTVTFTYTSPCAPFTTTCQATFTVPAAPTVVLNCPVNTTTAACQTQGAVDAAFATWLATASASGGCGGVLTNNNTGAPTACGGSTTVTFTYTSTVAPLTTTCQATFTVPNSSQPVLNCPAPTTASTCLTQAQLNTAYANWLAAATLGSGCSGGTITNNAPAAPLACNPSSTTIPVTFTYAGGMCQTTPVTCTSTFTTPAQPNFTLPAPGASTVNCPSSIVQPTPPTITNSCGEVLTPTGPTVTSVPTSITCEGTRTYTWTYTDCGGHVQMWSHVVTVERSPFLISTPPGSATVSCPSAADVTPTPPTVTSNCGEAITPTVTASPANDCEGDRVYTFTYTDCEGNAAAWLFTYHVVFQDFVVPTSIVGTVNCPSEIFEPTPPSVLDNCGNAITPVGPEVSTADNANGCETSRSYSWTYTDCSGTAHGWSQTFLVDYNGDFIAPLNEENHVACLAHAVAPFPQVLFDGCGQQMTVSGPTVAEDISPTGCSGVRTFTFAYYDCAGNTHPWSFTYYINDDQGPLGTCPSGGTVTVDVPNLLCIEDVPCPDDYDFTSKVQELLAAGGYFDVCDGITVNAELESWTDLWQCADADGNGVNTFGRTFYFRISDHCGNEYPSLCSVTYSGVCQPLATFPQTAWGIAGGTPGTSVGTTDLQLIGSLIPVNSPIVVGGSHRSLTVSDAQCVVDLLPGGSAPGPLANCHQTNCTGCNPMGIGGMKNPLAANAVALVLNVRYNVQQNELTLAAVRSQNLGCMLVSQNITSCASTVPGDCRLRVFEQSGAEHQFPYTLGGLLDLANLFLDGNLQLSIGQQQQYAAAINKALADANARWENGRMSVTCDQDAGASPLVEDNAGSRALPNATNTIDGLMALSPNPASNSVTLTLALDAPAQVRLDIRNQFGQLVMGRDLGTADRLAEQIDLTQLANGLYFVQVIAGQQRLEQKLVVSRD